MKPVKTVPISMYMKGAEYARLEAIAAKQRHNISSTMRLLIEDAADGVLVPDLSKRTVERDERRASMHVTEDLRTKIEALKASSEGLSMSEIMMRLIEAYEAKQGGQ